MDAFRCWIFINLSNTNDMSSAPKIIHVQNEFCPNVQYYMKVTKSAIHLNPSALLFFWVKLSETWLYMWSMKRSFASLSPKMSSEKCVVKMIQCKENFRTLLNFWDTHASYMYSTVKWSYSKEPISPSFLSFPDPPFGRIPLVTMECTGKRQQALQTTDAGLGFFIDSRL